MNGADVVFTGPDVPGEGEHKVMDYIRETKAQYDPEDESKCHPHWRPEMTHVLYGLDADLIMLGLVTHEPNFMLLREGHILLSSTLCEEAVPCESLSKDDRAF